MLSAGVVSECMLLVCLCVCVFVFESACVSAYVHACILSFLVENPVGSDFRVWHSRQNVTKGGQQASGRLCFDS